jgi:hypothetical protein
MSDPPWELLDEVWFLAPDDRLRTQRLVDRHLAYGRSWPAARERALGSDQANANRVNLTEHSADVVLRKIQ